MATNRKYEDSRYQYLPVGAGVKSGDPVACGTMTGVALTDRDTAGYSTIDFGGIYDLSVEAVDDDGNSAVAVGDKLYYTSTDDPVLTKKSSGMFFGFAREGITSGETATIEVMIFAGPGPGSADIIGPITTDQLADEAVTGPKIDADVAGAGLARAAETGILSVDVDDATIEIATDTLQVKDDGITADKIGADVAGSGLAQALDGSLDVDVDDATIEVDGGTGKVQVVDGGITLSKLGASANLAAVVAAGLGVSDLVAHDDTSPIELLAANGSGEGDRAVLVVAVCTESLAGETPPTFSLGQTAAVEKFIASASLAGATEGDVFIGAGALTEETALVATVTGGLGSDPAPAGEFSVTVLALPVASS